MTPLNLHLPFEWKTDPNSSIGLASMHTIQSATIYILPILMLVFFENNVSADDWKGWMGNHRDGVYRETGIIDEITLDGLKVKWRKPAGSGYSGPVVAGKRVFLFDYVKQSGDAFNDPGQRATLQGKERVTALDSETGETLWRHTYDCPYSISYPAGPRCSPTIDGSNVYTLGAEGDLKCLNIQDGSIIWERNLKETFAIEAPIWGFSSHPLIVGDLLYTAVGGEGQGVVAFNKRNGEIQWKALDSKSSYCPLTMLSAGGTQQLIFFHPEGVSSLNPNNGQHYWTVPVKPDYEMSIASPVVDGNRMYISSIRTEAVMLELDASQPAVKELWRGEPKNAVHCANSTPLFVDGVIFGTDCNDGDLVAVDGDNGNQLWTTFQPTKPDETRYIRHGTAFITRIRNSNQYFLMSESGDLILANLSAKGYKEEGRFHVLEPTSECFGRSVVWSHPAYAQRTLFTRNDEEIVAVSLATDDVLKSK